MAKTVRPATTSQRSQLRSYRGSHAVIGTKRDRPAAVASAAEALTGVPPRRREYEAAIRDERDATCSHPGDLNQGSPRSPLRAQRSQASTWIVYAVANPSAVITPTNFPPCS